MTDSIITANSLGDGLVVFLTADGGWTHSLDEARVIAPDALAEALAYGKAQHDARIVVEPYEIEVATRGRPAGAGPAARAHPRRARPDRRLWRGRDRRARRIDEGRADPCIAR